MPAFPTFMYLNDTLTFTLPSVIDDEGHAIIGSCLPSTFVICDSPIPTYVTLFPVSYSDVGMKTVNIGVTDTQASTNYTYSIEIKNRAP